MSEDPRHRRGREAEAIAGAHLAAHGLVEVARNWRCRHGELDLVMRDGDALVIVEVRRRLGRPAAEAALSVDPRKRERLRASALTYMSRSGLGDSLPVRLDIVAVGGTEREPELRWYRNIG